MAVDSKKILQVAKEGDNKVRFTVTISPAVLRDFKDACDKDGASYASVVETLMVDFLNGLKKHVK